MARYHAAKARINRRLSSMVYESAGAVRAAERREHPPGMRLACADPPITVRPCWRSRRSSTTTVWANVNCGVSSTKRAA